MKGGAAKGTDSEFNQGWGRQNWPGCPRSWLQNMTRRQRARNGRYQETIDCTTQIRTHLSVHVLSCQDSDLAESLNTGGGGLAVAAPPQPPHCHGSARGGMRAAPNSLEGSIREGAGTCRPNENEAWNWLTAPRLLKRQIPFPLGKQP